MIIAVKVSTWGVALQKFGNHWAVGMKRLITRAMAQVFKTLMKRTLKKLL